MQIWEADFYRRPLQDEQGQPLWELLLCDRTRTWEFSARCPQPEANAAWVVEQLKAAVEAQQHQPDRLQVFRPQALSLLAVAGKELGIEVEPTRRTFALKQLLREKAQQYSQFNSDAQQPYSPMDLDKPPPIPIAENIQGEQWRFAAIAAGQLAAASQAYEQRKQAAQGLHFLLVQPDDSGMTYSGFWLLQPVD
jgi:hypothetical protein